MMDTKKETFDFGTAIYALKEGNKVTREGWNGKGMFLFLADEIEFDTPADLSCVKDLKGDLTLPSIVMKTADDKFVVGWLASQTDMLADDWMVYENQQTEEKACADCGEGLCGNGDSCCYDSEPTKAEEKTDEENCAPPEDKNKSSEKDENRCSLDSLAEMIMKKIKEKYGTDFCSISIISAKDELDVDVCGDSHRVINALVNVLAKVSVESKKEDIPLDITADITCMILKAEMKRRYDEQQKNKQEEKK